MTEPAFAHPEVARFPLSTFAGRTLDWRTLRHNLTVWQTRGLSVLVDREPGGTVDFPVDVMTIVGAEEAKVLAAAELVVYSPVLAHHLRHLEARLAAQDPPPPPDPPIGSQP